MGSSQSRRRRKKAEGFGGDPYPSVTKNALTRPEGTGNTSERHSLHPHGPYLNKVSIRIRNVVKDLDNEIESWNRELNVLGSEGSTHSPASTGNPPTTLVASHRNYEGLAVGSTMADHAEALQLIVAHKERCEVMKSALLQSSLQLKAAKTKLVLTDSLNLIHDILTAFSNEETIKNMNALAWDVERKLAENRFEEEVQEWMLRKSGGAPSMHTNTTPETCTSPSDILTNVVDRTDSPIVSLIDETKMTNMTRGPPRLGSNVQQRPM